MGFVTSADAECPPEDHCRNQHEQSRTGRDGAHGDSNIQKNTCYVCGDRERQAAESKVGSKNPAAEAVFGMQL